MKTSFYSVLLTNSPIRVHVTLFNKGIM